VASKSLMEWQKMLWETWRTSAWCDSSRVVLCAMPSVVYRCSFVVLPCGGGVRLPFIDQGESESHACRAIWLREGAWCAMP
jgi:hypothetical protein